ncbi:calcium-independent phospholipase A2-gamma [Rhypophila decipiens]|uniref:Calcium-independent phospholipase A2-gamma n=1 Tax=Rhypophila decipiens TaxID=261697 RepID=A0AAN6Y0F8_9PEZI|nr:calcium-independent phospholipase A2-gamma [Rhypophila decipiens]
MSTIASHVELSNAPAQAAPPLARPHPLRDHHFTSDEAIDGPWARKVAIAFDGGGVRGYSSLLILKRIMEEIKRIELEHDPAAKSSAYYGWQGPQSPDGGDPPTSDGVYLPCHYFDYMAGTSTGGLSAIMLGRLRMSVDDALAQYTQFGNEVFGKARWWHERSILWYPRAKYPSRKVRAAFKRIIMEQLERMEDGNSEAGSEERASREPFKYREDRTRTMVFSFCIDKKLGVDRPHLWRTYDNNWGTNTLNGSRAHDEEIWKVARATSAAPRYFESIKLGGSGNRQKHFDGGMCANNPSLKAFWEIHHLHGQLTPAFFVSIGTGKKSPETTAEARVRLRDFDRVTKTDDVRRKQFVKKYLEIGSHWKDFMTDTEGDHGYQGWDNVGSLQNMPRVRFNVEGDLARIPLDDWRPTGSGAATLEQMRLATEQYLDQEDQRTKITEAARTLVRIRRERSKTERWESFAVDVTYRCPNPECALMPLYKTRDEFRKHVELPGGRHTGIEEDGIEDFLNTGRRWMR